MKFQYDTKKCRQVDICPRSMAMASIRWQKIRASFVKSQRDVVRKSIFRISFHILKCFPFSREGILWFEPAKFNILRTCQRSLGIVIEWLYPRAGSGRCLDTNGMNFIASWFFAWNEVSIWRGSIWCTRTGSKLNPSMRTPSMVERAY